MSSVYKLFYLYDLYNDDEEETDELLKELEKAVNEINGNSSEVEEEPETKEEINEESLREFKEIICYHRWETYHGLFETFEHCGKCGKKRLD